MSPFKVFSASIMHESHSFCILPASLARFHEAGGYKRDDEIPKAFRGTRTEWGAVFDLADEFGWQVVHPLYANTMPTGPVTREAYEHFSDVILSGLRRAMPVDGLLLPLHGAMLTEHVDDAEGEFLRRIRDIVGPAIPIAVTLDLHANVGPALARHANIVSTYRTTPHVDLYETAQRAGRLLQRAMNGEIRPTVAYAQGRMFNSLDQGRTISGKGPMVDILAKAKAILAREPNILDIGINAGFDWSDKANVGSSVLVTGEGRNPRYQRVADELIEFAWQTRKDKTIELLPLDQAMRIAKEPSNGKGPLLIGDYTDCPAGGGMGDGTNLLKAMIDAGIEDAVLGAISDPAAAEMACKAGIGATVTLKLGGKYDPSFGGKPIEVTGRVLAVSDGNAVRKGPFATGTIAAFGRSCLVQVGTVKVIIASVRNQIDDREQFRIFGIDPERVNVLACKAMNHFRADFEKMGRRLIYADSGGITSFDWKRYPYKRVRRPVWPLDDI
jgi:microcystin degradation protein MlrC